MEKLKETIKFFVPMQMCYQHSDSDLTFENT